ncbi:16S rRNA (cytidine(1402)-2'-O)-methyltransferase [Myxococcota bacterium]|nr:16S rRNA (cytidine(1402)-2'-O)-methyltransferase [Myxococcota bacterium]
MNAATGGRLSVVAVPIGNLEDITLRALRSLREAEIIACEDTRRTSQLLELLGLPRPTLVAVHDHNEDRTAARVLEWVQAGRRVVLVSDAGTPAISDPGYPVVKAVAEAGLAVVPIPGPCAAIAALCASGLATDRFRFVGFPPARRDARRAWLETFAGAPDTLVFYVPPHDLETFLEEAAAVLGSERPAVIARELTKMYETFERGTLGHLAKTPGVVRGEVVVLVGGAAPEGAPDDGAVESAARAVLAEGFTGARAAKELVRRTGVDRDTAYRAILSARHGASPEAGEPSDD